MRTEWIRALGPSAGAGTALAAGCVCAVLAVMGAMGFGLGPSVGEADAGALAIPPAPSQAPAPAPGLERAGARAVRATAVRDASPGRTRRPASPAVVVAERPSAQEPAVAPSPRATSGPPAPQPVGQPAAVSDAARAPATTSVVATTAPQLPSSGGSLPQPVRDAPATVRGTAEAVLAPVGRVADAAVADVRAVAEPVVDRVPGVVPAPVVHEAAGVVTGALPGRAPSP